MRIRLAHGTEKRSGATRRASSIAVRAAMRGVSVGVLSDEPVDDNLVDRRGRAARDK